MKKHFYVYLISLLVLSFMALAFELLISTLFKEMFDAIAKKNYEEMINSVRFYMIIILILIIFLPIFYFLLEKANAITSGNIRKNLFNKLGKLPLKYFSGNHSGDIISRMTNDVSETEKVYNHIFVELVTAIIVGIGTSIYSFYLDYRLALVSIIGAGITLFVNFYYARILRKISAGVQEKLAKLNESLTNILDGVFIIRSFNLQRIILKKFTDKNSHVYDSSVDRVKIQSVIAGLNTVIGFINFVGLVSAGAYLAIIGEISIGKIIAVIQLQNGIHFLVNALGSFITNLQPSLASSDRVFEVLDETEEPETYDLTDVFKVNSEYLIEMDNLSFQYESESVINDISMQIQQGKIIALVGPSGGGKSTIFKLLLNFYKPTSGNLLINGKSIREQKIKDIRKSIAYVPQNSYLYTGSIEDNIRHGNMNATTDDIIEAAKKAFAHDFIIDLPDGYKTTVGERGAKLSGGQRQRIAIARAILKDAPILLLDEATSSLDTESESLVQEAIKELMKGKTTLVIAHRLSTVQDAEEILVLKAGCIVEKGTHEELMKLDGVYQNLYNTQFTTA